MKNFFSTFFTRKPAAVSSTLPGTRDSRLSLRDTSENGLRQQLVLVMLRDLLRKSGIPPSWVDCHVQVANSRSKGQGLYVRLVLKHWDERLMKYSFAFQKALLTNIVQFEPKAAGWLHGITWQLEVASHCPYPDLPDKNFWVYTAPGQAAPLANVPANAPAGAPAGVSAGVLAGVLAGVPRGSTTRADKTMPVAAAQAASHSSSPALPPASSLFSIDKTAPQPAPQNEARQDLEKLFAIRDHELAHRADMAALPAGYESTEPSPLA